MPFCGLFKEGKKEGREEGSRRAEKRESVFALNVNLEKERTWLLVRMRRKLLLLLLIIMLPIAVIVIPPRRRPLVGSWPRSG